jgi:hypothetical protein
MKKIKVTPEIHDRVMEHIHHLDLNDAEEKTVTHFPYKRYLSIAACFALLFVGSYFIYNITNPLREPSQQAIPDIAEYNSIKALSKAVGFNVRQIQKLPFEAEEVKYSAYWKKLAQIEYISQENTVSYRMAAGSEDISGDYNQYTSVKSIPLNDINVTLKGDQDKYVLAIWQSGDYSYSINLSNGITETQMLEIVQSVR